MPLLRVITAGSVDDGKSTLIGRLLVDAEAVPTDQLEALPEDDLSLLSDGLAAEREQKITIDVAYRYFSTGRRKFILADCPGHVEYTRNLVTAASTADAAVVLLDGRKGVLPQSRRHSYLASLLGVRHLVFAINKMDLVHYSEARFREIVAELDGFVARLQSGSVTYLPISALHGDNVVRGSEQMPWYTGLPLLGVLESLHRGPTRNQVDLRFPVQLVLRPNQDFRGLAGRVASGAVRVGDAVVALPGGVHSYVQSIHVGEDSRGEAESGDSVILQLTDSVDVGRGGMLVHPDNLPRKARELDATLCWLDGESRALPGADYVLQHTTQRVEARLESITHRLDVCTLETAPAALLESNDIGRVQLSCSSALFFDTYARNRATGSFLLIDPESSRTVAAGMILGESPNLARLLPQKASSHTVPVEPAVSRSEKEARQGYRAAVVWLTGLSGAGKTTLAQALERRLFELGRSAVVLDGDQLRQGLNSNLEFSAEDRRENVRRAAEVARLLWENGVIAICSLISPHREARAFARSLIAEGRFFEVYVRCSLQTCAERDPKSLYARALSGEIKNFTGIQSAYEEPVAPELVLETDSLTVDEEVDRVLALLL